MIVNFGYYEFVIFSRRYCLCLQRCRHVPPLLALTVLLVLRKATTSLARVLLSSPVDDAKAVIYLQPVFDCSYCYQFETITAAS
jgi:hypothetical protein